MGLGVGSGTDSVGTVGGATDFFLKVFFKKLVNFPFAGESGGGGRATAVT